MLTQTLVRGFFLLSSSTILFLNAIPQCTRLLVYGKLATPAKPTATTAPHTPPPPSPPKKNTILSRLARVVMASVPHSFFTHLYVLGVSLAFLFGVQIALHGRFYVFLRDAGRETGSRNWIKRRAVGVVGQSVQQVVLAWACFTVQTGRRLYECLSVHRPGKSRMLILHYLLGVCFYTAVGVGIWIEGTDAIDAYTFTPSSVWALIGPPSLRSFVGITLFIVGSGLQHDCHAYLASLEKYTLPTHPAFRKIVCPHYFAECIVYVGFAIMTGHGRRPFNVTMITALVFTMSGLGVLSSMNREWYVGKFGEKSMEGRWNMIPFIY